MARGRCTWTGSQRCPRRARISSSSRSHSARRSSRTRSGLPRAPCPGSRRHSTSCGARSGGFRGHVSSSPRWRLHGLACRSRGCTLARSRCSERSTRSNAAGSSSSGTSGRSRPATSCTSRGSSTRSRRSRARAPSACTRGRWPSACSQWTESSSHARDLESYEPRWREPAIVSWNGYRVATRGGLSGVPELLVRLPRFAAPRRDRARPGARRLRSRPQTWVASTRRTWLPSTATGERASSRTAWAWAPASGCRASTRSSTTCWERATSPTASLGPETVSRAAWPPRSSSTTRGSRSRSAQRERRGSGPRSSASSPRSSTRGSTPRARSRGRASTPRRRSIDAEPGVDERALETLESRGRNVRRWDRLHHYFGGVSCVGRTGAAGDPRRSGTALLL